MKWKELATVGIDIDEKDYHFTIILSLPYSLANFTSNQLAAAKLYSLMKTISHDALISLISEEYKQQQTQHSHCNGGQEKSKDQDKNKALNISSSGKSIEKGKFEQKPHGVCWNCEKKGHYKDKCLKPAADKKNDSPKSKASTANATIESNSEVKEAFFMEPEISEDESDIPELEAASDFDGDKTDWFSKVKDDRTDSAWNIKKLSGVD